MRRSERERLIAFVVLIVGASIAAAALIPRLLHAAAGPEPDILIALKSHEHEGVTLPVPGSPVPLVSDALAIDRVTLNLESNGSSARVSFTLDFSGKLGATQVSALGREVTPLVLQDGHWQPPPGQTWLPTLSGAVGALSGRVRDLEAGDLQALVARVAPGEPAIAARFQPELHRFLALKDRHYRVKTWYLRADRQPESGATTVVVTEEYRLEGATPERPVDLQGSRRLRLIRVGQEFLFDGSLM